MMAMHYLVEHAQGGKPNRVQQMPWSGQGQGHVSAQPTRGSQGAAWIKTIKSFVFVTSCYSGSITDNVGMADRKKEQHAAKAQIDR